MDNLWIGSSQLFCSISANSTPYDGVHLMGGFVHGGPMVQSIAFLVVKENALLLLSLVKKWIGSNSYLSKIICMKLLCPHPEH